MWKRLGRSLQPKAGPGSVRGTPLSHTLGEYFTSWGGNVEEPASLACDTIRELNGLLAATESAQQGSLLLPLRSKRKPERLIALERSVSSPSSSPLQAPSSPPPHQHSASLRRAPPVLRCILVLWTCSLHSVLSP